MIIYPQVPQRMMECGIATNDADSISRASQLIVASVDRARAAIAKHSNITGESNTNATKTCIAGCIPPLTECYFSNLVPSSVDRLVSDYTVILSTLLTCNVDILLAETLSTTREAQAILRSLHNIIADQSMTEKLDLPPLWMSLTIHDDDPSKLRSDELLETACATIIEEATYLNLPLEAIGINCSAPKAISMAVPMLTKLVEGTDIKVCAYGNCFQTTTSEWINSLGIEANASAGTSTAEQQVNVLDSSTEDYDDAGYLIPEVYAKFAIEWAQSGAQIIGGCCGSRPIHMEKVASALKDYQQD
jgi:S-methylmethionine-dependent homocysteine/selenocysteine methylase